MVKCPTASVAYSYTPERQLGGMFVFKLVLGFLIRMWTRLEMMDARHEKYTSYLSKRSNTQYGAPRQMALDGNG
jgi:hypothetical protein